MSLSVSTAVQQLRRDGLEREFFCRGRGVSLSVSGAAEKRWLGDRFFFGGEEVCRCQSVQQLRRDGLDCVGDRQFFGGEEVCYKLTVSLQQCSS